MAASDTPKKPFHVAVCGGGIGGLCTILGLVNQNIPRTLYEAASAFGEIGAGVGFGQNALAAMSLIDPEIKRGYNKIATSNALPEKKKVWFEFNLGQKDDMWGDIKAPGKEMYRIAQVLGGDVGQSTGHRAHFLDVLVDLVPEGITKFGKRFEQIEESGEKLVLTFQDGTTASADAVIGCDGVKSKTRQILLGHQHSATDPIFTGKYAYRGLISMDKVASAIGDELARNAQMYLGYMGHVLTYPIEGEKTMNVVAFQTKRDGKWEDEKWVLPMKKEVMLNDFAGWGDCVQKMQYSDAAHASTPHQGAGAGQAIEDAFILTNLLGKVNSVEGIEKAFQAYDAVRRPRSQKVVATSRDAAAIYEFEDEELGVDLDLLKKALETRYNWIWDEDLNRELEKALAILGAPKASL